MAGSGKHQYCLVLHLLQGKVTAVLADSGELIFSVKDGNDNILGPRGVSTPSAEGLLSQLR